MTRNGGEEIPSPNTKFGDCIVNGFKEYKSIRTPGIPWPSKLHSTPALNYAGLSYLTACKNHVVLNFYGRISKYWKRCFRNYKFKKRKKGSFFYWLTKMLLDEMDISDEEWNSKITQIFSKIQPDEIQKCKDSYNNIRQHLLEANVLPFDKDNISKNWQQLLKPLLWIRKHIDECIKETNENEEKIDEKSKLGKCFRKFSLLPIPSLDAKYMTIDMAVLKDLWSIGIKAARQKNLNIDIPSSFQSDEDVYTIWKKSFLRLKLKNKIETHYFDCRIQTDGMGASLTWRRPKVIKEDKEDEKKKLENQNYEEYKGPDPRRNANVDENLNVIPNLNVATNPSTTYIAIDPGKKEFIVAVRKNESTPFLQVNSKAWYGPEYINSEKRKLQKLKKYTSNVHEVPSNEIPSLKTVNQNEWAIGVKYITGTLIKTLRYYGSNGCKRLRWGGYIATQKALCNLVNKLACDTQITDVAFGNWGNASGLTTGYRSGPVKKLTRALQKDQKSRFCVHIIDEYCSSKLCCRCDKKLFAPKDKNVVEEAKKNNKKVKSIWGIRVCKNCGPEGLKDAEGGDITWNRNTNAAHNILRARFDPERPSRLRAARQKKIEERQLQENNEQMEVVPEPNLSVTGGNSEVMEDGRS